MNFLLNKFVQIGFGLVIPYDITENTTKFLILLLINHKQTSEKNLVFLISSDICVKIRLISQFNLPKVWCNGCIWCFCLRRKVCGKVLPLLYPKTTPKQEL